MECVESPLISVIVPVYNVEKYLKQCIDSILKQKYKNFELLLIDDGSKDRSSRICDSYFGCDPRVRVFHKSNGGVSSARNVGLDNANGEYVVFVDSDDMVTPDYLTDLYGCLENRNDVDLVIQGFRLFRGETISLFGKGYNNLKAKTYLYCKDSFDELLVKQNLTKNGYCFSKLYKMKLLEVNNLRFPTELSFCEDLYFMLDYLLCIENKVLCSDVKNYLYRERNESAVHLGFENFRNGYDCYRMIKAQSLRFIDRYNCDIEIFDVAYLLHRAIMTAKNTSQLRSITAEDWKFFLQQFKVFTRKTKLDRWMISHFKSLPCILLAYIKACRSFRNFLARINLWGILNMLKK